jgi:hypothetical protein
MDVPDEISRLIPRWAASPTREDAKRLIAFLRGLDRAGYEQALRFLPARLTHHREELVPDEDAWYEYVQVACFGAIVNYDRHVPGEMVLRLLTSKSGLGPDLARLAQMLSEPNRKRLPMELLRREAMETIVLLEAHFAGNRLGIADYAIELMLDRLHGELGRKQAQIVQGLRRPGDNQFNRSQAHEYKLLRMIQALRRQDPARLPKKPTTTEEVRFLAEETSRDLFGYESRDTRSATAHIAQVLAWVPGSKFYQNTRKNVAIYLVETGFFANLGEVRSKIRLVATYEPHWDYYIRGPLRSEKFWNDIAGLNEDVPIGSTEAGTRQQVYQQAAVVGGLLFAGMIAVPIVIQLAWAAPGVAIRLVTWTGRTLWLAARYVQTSVRVYGFFGGSAKMVRDGYEYYMQNAVVINQRMLDVTEIVLDVFTEGTGSAPNASLADQTRLATEKLAVAAEKGIASLAHDAANLAKHPGYEIEFVQVIVKDVDGKLIRTVGKVDPTSTKGLRLVDLEKTDVTGQVEKQAEKTLTLIGKPAKETPSVPDLRGTTPPNLGTATRGAARATLPGPPQHFPFGGGGKSLPKPESPNKVYRIMSLDEASKTLKDQKLPPPLRGAEGERFVSLDSDYVALFREKELDDLAKPLADKARRVQESLESIDKRLLELKQEKVPDFDAISKLGARREKLLAEQHERGIANKLKADEVLGDWHAAPGQQVVVEIELEAGTIDDILMRAVNNEDWGSYSKSGKDVFMWKVERGYGRNIGIPKWQLDGFNAKVKAVRMHAFKQPLGKTKPGLGKN